MRTKYISIVTFLLCLFVTAPDINAKGGKFFKWLGKNLGSAAAGWVDKTVEKNLSSEEHRETWRGMVRDFNSNMGINESYANAGRNWAEGKKKDSFVDVGEAALSDAGVNNAGVNTALNFARIQNDYNRNIESGMSTKEAYERRSEKLKELLVNVCSNAFDRGSDSNSQWEKEEKAWEAEYENGIYSELKRRGYSSDEAQAYMAIIHESPGLLRGLSGIDTKENDEPEMSYEEKYKKKREAIEHMTSMLTYDEGIQSRIKEMLDDLNIRDRGEDENFSYSKYENSFFGTPAYMPEEPEEKDKNIVGTPQETPQTTSIPVVDERANAAKAISRTVLNNYSINDVNLSDAQKAELDQVADKMTKFDDIQIDILGHTCNIGTQQVNQNIGERRAIAAKKYLMSKGISEKRIQVESRGFSEPVADNDNEEHRMQNRRVTFNVK